MYDFSRLKELNSNISSKKIKRLNRLTMLLIVMGVLLIVLLRPENPAPFVMLIFFSLIGFMISLFGLLIKLSNNYKQIMKNSLKVVYHDQLLIFNINNDSTYKINVESPSNVEFELFPGFLSSEIDYTLDANESSAKLYKTKLYFSGGQKRTIFFQGSYYCSNIEFDEKFIYTSLSGFGSKIAAMITPKNLGKNAYLLNELTNKVDYLKGSLKFERNSELPLYLNNLINNLHEEYPNQTIRVGVINKTLHVAIDYPKHTPVIRKYSKKELIAYKDLVEFDTLLLNLICDSIQTQ